MRQAPGWNINEPIRLDEVPPLVFSEVMRDVDLFVGVASIGADQTWQDGGRAGQYRDYWHLLWRALGYSSYSMRGLAWPGPASRDRGEVFLLDRFLGKAFLLAEDATIKDPTINRHIDSR